MKEEITSRNVLEKWANQYEPVKVWLANIQQKRNNAYDLYRFCQWANKDPNQLLALKDDPANKEMERLLDQLKISDYYSLAVRRRIIIAVKSLFKWNYRSISSAAGIIDYTKEAPYHRLTKENLRKIWRACFNPRDRFIIDLTFCTAIAKESMTHLKWRHLEPNWRDQEFPHVSLEDKIIKGHGRGKYKGVRQETFLTPEAKRDLIEYVEWLEKLLRRQLTPDDPIFFQIQKPYTPLTYGNVTRIFVDLRKRSGIKFTAHDGRRYVENTLENASIHINRCRKIRGRKVRGEEAPYSQPEIEQLREEYAKVVPDLEFQREEPLTQLEKRQEIVEALTNKLVSGQPWTDEDRANIKRYGIQLRERAGRPMIKNTEANGGSTDCGEQFEQINEKELLGYLKEGWRVVHRLQNGEVIIRKG